MNQKKVYKSYPKEFIEEAVELVTEQGYSVAEAAESLGVRANQLYDWKAKIEVAKQDGGWSAKHDSAINTPDSFLGEFEYAKEKMIAGI